MLQPLVVSVGAELWRQEELWRYNASVSIDHPKVCRVASALNRRVASTMLKRRVASALNRHVATALNRRVRGAKKMFFSIVSRTGGL